MAKKLTTEEFYQRVLDKWGKGVWLLIDGEEYMGSTSPMKMKCGYCGEISEKSVAHSFLRNRCRFCLYKDPKRSAEKSEKTKKTNLEKYGAVNPLQNKIVREKAKQTNLERYGFEHPMQSQKVKEKTRKTNLERYGFENVGQSPEIKEKVRETNLRKLGVEYPAQSLKVREKMRETIYKNKLLSKKNTASQLLFRSKETLEEALLSLGESLGRLPYLDEIVEASGYAGPSNLYRNLNLTDYLSTHYQVRLGFSKAEYEISNFLSQYYEIVQNSRSLLSNTSMSGKEIDIYIPSLNIGIEFNGLYWHSTEGPGLKALKPQSYHRDKYVAAQQNGIFLIQVFEDEYIIDPEACLENLLYTLIANEERIYPLISEDLDAAVVDLCKTNPLDNQYLVAGWQMVEEIIENYFFVDPKTFQRFSEEEIPEEDIPQYYKIYGAGLQIWRRPF